MGVPPTRPHRGLTARWPPSSFDFTKLFIVATSFALACSRGRDALGSSHVIFIVDMGFFSKLFGGEEKPQPKPLDLKPVSEMIDEDRYWQLIHETKELSGGDQGRQEDLLVAALEKLSPKDIVGFRLRTDKLLFDTYNPHLWCAGYIMNGGLSDDGFEYFRLWLIDQGREVFERAKADPDSLADYEPDVDPDQGYDFETLSYVADKAFENKTGGHWLYEYIDGDNFPYRAGDYPELQFTWQEDNPESTRRLCPNLMAKYGKP